MSIEGNQSYTSSHDPATIKGYYTTFYMSGGQISPIRAAIRDLLGRFCPDCSKGSVTVKGYFQWNFDRKYRQ